MKVILLSAALFLAASDGHTESEIIAKVETRFDSVKSLSAKFNQSFYDATVGDTERSSGTVLIKKPLKMKWRYDKPYEQTILSDGEKIYFHFPSDKQVLVESIGNIIDSRSPVLFLAGGYKLRELFTIRLESSGEKDKMAELVKLELVPKERSVSATKIILTVESKSWDIRSFSIFDWTGNRTDIEFTYRKINNNVGDVEFKFKAPLGADIIQMPNPKFGVKK